MAEYQEKLYDVEAIPAPDDLIAGASAFTGKIAVTQTGDYKRGEILMRSGSEFVHGTVDGVTSASELCILCRNMTLTEGTRAEVYGYFMGAYNTKRVSLNGELLTDYDESEIETVTEALRKQKIFLR